MLGESKIQGTLRQRKNVCTLLLHPLLWKSNVRNSRVCLEKQRQRVSENSRAHKTSLKYLPPTPHHNIKSSHTHTHSSGIGDESDRWHGIISLSDVHCHPHPLILKLNAERKPNPDQQSRQNQTTPVTSPKATNQPTPKCKLSHK